MHRRAARTLVAALAAVLLAPATAGAYTITADPQQEADVLVFDVALELGDNPVGQFDPQPGTATEGVDFDGTPRMRDPITGEVRVPVTDDAMHEPDETVRLVGPGPSPDEGTGTIGNDDPIPALSVGDLSVSERDGPAKVVVSASNPNHEAIVVPLSRGAGTAGAADFSGPPPNVTLPAGESAVEVSLPITNDFEDEADETISILIPTAPPNATIADPEGIVTIVNDDLRVVDLFDASTPEGDGGTSVARFEIRLNAPTFRTVVVGYTTVDGVARAPADYLARLGSVTFGPGETVEAVDVPVVGDDIREDPEAFGMRLTGVSDTARMGDGVAVGAIVDDDGEGPPGIGGGDPGRGGTGGAGTAPGGDVRPPQMTLGAPKRSGRRISVRVGCPSGERTCAGRLTLFTVPDRRSRSRTLRRERRIGAKSFRLRGGRATRLSIEVPGSILRAARRAGRLRLQVFAVTQDAAANVDTRTTRATLRYRRSRS